jgi:hypothetical protein
MLEVHNKTLQEHLQKLFITILSNEGMGLLNSISYNSCSWLLHVYSGQVAVFNSIPPEWLFP